jgi:hypothetical protein
MLRALVLPKSVLLTRELVQGIKRYIEEHPLVEREAELRGYARIWLPHLHQYCLRSMDYEDFRQVVIQLVRKIPGVWYEYRSGRDYLVVARDFLRPR